MIVLIIKGKKKITKNIQTNFLKAFRDLLKIANH